jgi:hypothetical protein
MEQGEKKEWHDINTPIIIDGEHQFKNCIIALRVSGSQLDFTLVIPEDKGPIDYVIFDYILSDDENM